MIRFQRVASGPCRALVNDSFAAAVSPLLEAGDGLASLSSAAEPAQDGSGRAAGGSGRAPTRILALPGHAQRVHLRTVRRGGLLAAVAPWRVFGEARARRELELTGELHDRGLPVALPVLLAGERAGPFWRGVVGCVHLEDHSDARRFLDRDPGRGPLLRALRSAAQAVRSLHDAGLQHPDLNLGNLLVDASGAHVHVIDLDGARVRSGASPRARMRQIMRLHRSCVKWGLDDRIGPRGRAAFLSAYCGRDRALRRALLRGLWRERLRLAFHELGYARHR